MDKYRAAAAAHGMAEIPDVVDLWYLQDRDDVADWLRGRGGMSPWRARTNSWRAITAAPLRTLRMRRR